MLVSDLSGRGNILYKLKQHGLADRLDEDARRELLERIKQMEYEGYELEAAEGTFELLVREALHPGMQFFDVDSYEVATRAAGTAASHSTATVTLKAQDGIHSATETGHGPFNALHVCLRKCLAQALPADRRRPPDRLQGARARFQQGHRRQRPRADRMVRPPPELEPRSGVSDNVIEASWKALVDAIRLELMRLTEKDDTIEKAVEDYCWGV